MNWKGLLAEERTWERSFIFSVHLVMMASLIFMQMGFLPLSVTVPHVGSVLTVVGPVVATALLLGAIAGGLQGLLAGGLLLLHSHIQPCDIAEHLCVTPLGALGMTLVGVVAGLLCAFVLRGNPTGKRRLLSLASMGAATSILATSLFVFGTFTSTSVLMPAQSSSAWSYTCTLIGSPVVQVACNFAVAFGFSLIADSLARIHLQPRDTMSVRLLFRVQLLGMVSLVLLVGAACAFMSLTQYCWLYTNNDMSREAEHLLQCMSDEIAAQGDVEHALPAFETMVSMYDLETDGTITLCDSSGILATNNDARDEVGRPLTETMHDKANDPNISMVFYDQDLGRGVELGFVRVSQNDDLSVMLIRPATTVYRQRFYAMSSIATTTVILLGLVYVYAARLLALMLADPIDRTNASLAQITSGDLDAVVDERRSFEFSSLSDGINTTVAALKDYAEESARRIEEDLATARIIQQSALPRMLPQSDSIRSFDIYASMIPSKEVGGDFYDYFLVDDHTLGFLVADVSGKGIPAALFMMEAKKRDCQPHAVLQQPGQGDGCSEFHTLRWQRRGDVRHGVGRQARLADRRAHLRERRP